jgi:membrane carboxypeptidase/penicillin-binding protein
MLAFNPLYGLTAAAQKLFSNSVRKVSSAEILQIQGGKWRVF